MNNTDLRTFATNNYGVDFDTLSADAENVIRRCFDADETPDLVTFLATDGLTYIRFDS